MNTPTPDPLELLTPEQVASIIKIHTGTLKNWRMAGIGPAWIRIGTGAKPHIRYRRADLETWLANR